MRYPMTKKVGLWMVVLVLAASSAYAYPNGVSYSGQGLIADGFGGYDLQTEICGVANGAAVDGPYILWVLTATGATAADITGPWGTAAMTRSGKGNGAFKLISAWYDPSTLAPGGVVATYNGRPKNAQLVISHGCRPFLHTGAWCSPGFWRNATDGAWARTGHSHGERFNVTVFDVWYGATFAADPTLDTVLASLGGTFTRTPVPGTSGYELNAFRATGAFLTDEIPGYRFDWDLMKDGSSDGCPIDHFGNYK
jgi:hypothetical protein